jgi:energy-coupling factor transport system permease protein
VGEGARLMPIYLYIDRGTFVHRLHPTVKVFSLFVMFWSVYWVDNPIALLVPIGLIMLWIAQLTDSWPNFYRLRWLFVILIFTTTLMWMVFYQRGTPIFTLTLFHFGAHTVAIKVTRLSIKFGLGRGIKLAELLAASVLFLSTTKIEEFTYGLQRMRVPYRVSFAISLSFRLVPLFIDSAVTIVDAQRLRGYDFNQGGPLERVRRYVPVVIPVFMGALRKANNMAMALEARGFGFSHEPTTFIEYPVTVADVIAFAFLIGLGTLYFMLYWTGLGGIGPLK